jgi:hypothetical protein
MWLVILVGLALLCAGSVPVLAQTEDRGASNDNEGKIPSAAELETQGAIVGKILIDNKDVFDTSQPGENKSLFRLANRLHIITRDSVIEQQLLFRSGDKYSKRLLEESERLLRRNSYLFDAKITPIKYENGVVDLRVWTRDLWTLMPGFSVSRSGGENRTRVSISERNLVGTGITLKLSYTDDVDRDSTSFEYLDRNVGKSWTTAFIKVADNSDGGTTLVSIVRPFYALDTRRAAGAVYLDDERIDSFYSLGNRVAEYTSETSSFNAYAGWSAGLSGSWVRRWTAGIVLDDRAFLPVPDGDLPSLIPDNRRLNYPFIAYERLEDQFETTSNRDMIGRTEDFYMGTRFSASLGWADESFGSDRDSLLYNFSARRGFGAIKKKALILSSMLRGRIDDGESANTELGIVARYYNQITNKRLFFTTVEGSIGNNLDLDNLVELGGDSGLRGYPLRYQTGDSKVIITVEQRYFTDWYPFKLFRVGGAIFADVGRTWGDNPVGAPSLGWLKDVGFGLRLGPTRASGRDVIHIDVAFPLDGDPSIDSVQFLIQSKKSF